MTMARPSCPRSNRVSQALRSLADDARLSVEGQEARSLRPSSIPCTYKVAASIEDRRRAWRLVYDVYHAKGLAASLPSGLWMGLHDLLIRTITFTAERAQQPVANLTLVFDSPLGLPAESVCGETIGRLRASGRKVCELISLVSVEDHTRTGTELIMTLFKLAYLTARKIEHGRDLIITVNPRHAPFYQRYLLFERMGDPQPCDRVGGAPAVALRLDLDTAPQRYRNRFGSLSGPRNHYRFFTAHEAATLEWIRRHRRPLSEHAVRTLFEENRSSFALGTPKQRGYVLYEYQRKNRLEKGKSPRVMLGLS